MNSTNPIPSQADHDPTKPEEHFLWALRNLPSFAGSGVITHSGFLRTWSDHLWKCGFAHRDYLESLADVDGNIHISRLPKQTIKFQPAFRGPSHTYNNAARWVEANAPDPEPIRLPDIRKLTDQENLVMIEQYKAAGWIKPDLPKPALAEEFN